MAVTINMYDKFIEYVGDGGIDLDDDTFDIILMTTTHSFTSTDLDKADIAANEIPTGNGYTQGAKTLTTVAWTESSGTLTFNADDVTWTASGGPIPTSGDCGDAVIYSETSTAPTDDLLMCSVDFDGAQSAGIGTDFKITWDVSGIFTIG